MTLARYVGIAVLLLMLTACGRRLPDDYFDTNTDFAAENVETEEVAAVDVEPTAVATSTEAETGDNETVDTEATEEATTPEENNEPQFELVEVPLDPIVEQVANADPVNGEVLFGSGVPCSTCHQVNTEQQLVGPGFLNLPTRAENRIEGVVAERYIYSSITHPNEYVVEGFAEGVMPQTYADTYSEEELYDLIAYLMTLGDYPEREPNFMEVPVSGSGDTDAGETFDAATATPEATASESDSSGEEGETVVIVVTATPMSDESSEDSSSETETTEESTGEEPEVVLLAPNFDLDLSGVPDTVDFLADHGLPERGEALFTEALVSGTSCSTCHSVNGNPISTQTDVGTVGAVENAPAYIWAAIFSSELHPGFASQYERTLSGADTSHLVAYLISLSEAGE